MSSSPSSIFTGDLTSVTPERRKELLRALIVSTPEDLGTDRVGYRERFVEVAIELLRNASLMERVAFSHALGRLEQVPDPLAEVLLRDVVMVSSPLLASGRLSDEVLFSITEEGRAEASLVAVAQREHVPLALSERLMEENSLRVAMALAANPGAELSPASFEILSDIAVGDRGMDAALSKRPDLPIHIAKKMHQRLTFVAARRVDEMITRDKLKQRTHFTLKPR